MKDATQDARSHLSAVVGVCDEREIIGHCLDHLEHQHVDSIVVVDMMSRDGTRELLHGWRDAGRIALIERDNDPKRDADFLAAGVDYARRTFGAEWILIQDADEFCVHASGDLHAAIGAIGVNAVGIERFNACLGDRLLHFFAESGGDVASRDIWVAPLRLSREFMDQNPEIVWSSAQPVPKVLARSQAIFGITAGGHAVLGANGAPHPAVSDPALLMVHVPFLSFGRFRRKIERARALVASDKAYFVGGTGWHWRRWIEILEDEALEMEYAKQILVESSFSDLQGKGVIARADAYIQTRIMRAAEFT